MNGISSIQRFWAGQIDWGRFFAAYKRCREESGTGFGFRGLCRARGNALANPEDAVMQDLNDAGLLRLTLL